MKKYIIGRILLYATLLVGVSFFTHTSTFANVENEVMIDVLVKFKSNVEAIEFVSQSQISLKSRLNQIKETNIQPVGGEWFQVEFFVTNPNGMSEDLLTTQFVRTLSKNKMVSYVQPNFILSIPEKYRLSDSALQSPEVQKLIETSVSTFAIKDNPAIPGLVENEKPGWDPLVDKQWGMLDNGMKNIWPLIDVSPPKNPNVVLAVIDTGVDYTHEDLVPNLWRNKGEMGLDQNGKNKETNGVDDDNNGYVDDVIGYDFFSNDPLPYDMTVPLRDLILGGGNPGHGTHCAGSTSARVNNSKGIGGIAPNIKLMSLRFISEKGEGSTANAIRAIRYAVDNGAWVLSNSWGSEGEDPKEVQENKALRETIEYAQARGVLFVAAAGNGHKGVGYDNDTDARPGVPASYPMENIISVAAIDSKDQLGSFSNWGVKTVDVAAPGLSVFSTMVGNKYSNKVIEVGKFSADWDGTSMACPHVAGAAALYWAYHPEKNWLQVKNAILSSVKNLPALNGKILSGGKLSIENLLKVQ